MNKKITNILIFTVVVVICFMLCFLIHSILN